MNIKAKWWANIFYWIYKYSYFYILKKYAPIYLATTVRSCALDFELMCMHSIICDMFIVPIYIVYNI